MVVARKGIPATKWPPHAQWARPAGHIVYFINDGTNLNGPVSKER
jgi:hypothetical protein